MDDDRQSLLDDYANRAVNRPRALLATVLRTGSYAGREILAYLASGRQMGYESLVEMVRAAYSADPKRRDALSDSIDREWFSRLAWALAVQGLDGTDREDAVRFFDVIETLVGRVNLTTHEANLFAQTLISLGRPSEAEERIWDLPLAANERSVLATDLMNPFLVGRGSAEVWLLRLENTMGFDTHAGLIGLAEGSETPFDRLGAFGQIPVRSGPLISVVVTTFQPGVGLVTAVRSILEQSWQDTEVLVIDDGSPKGEYLPLLTTVSDMDTRVRLIRMGKNRGTYRARNVGLAAASGRFVTFQDSDDWSHPLRIEMQVEPMLQDSNVMATTSECIRASQELVISSPGYPLSTLNTSSLMFRTHEVLGRVGFMDGIRKAADTEYLRRIKLAFEDGYRHLERPALAIVRLDSKSLSRNEFRPGWQHQARGLYQQSYDHWHSLIAAGASPYVYMNAGKRRFPAPSRYQAEPPSRQEYDVVFVGDWRAFGGPQKSMIEEIRALREVGASVAVCHMESFRFMTTQRQPLLCEPIQVLERKGDVSVIMLDDESDVGLAIIRYPPILQFPPRVEAGWRIERLWIVANQAPSEIDGSDVRYLPDDCDRNARDIFGLEPVWVPQSERIRAILRERIPPGALAPFNNPGIIRSEEWYSEHSPDPARAIRMGRYSRDSRIKFPKDRDQMIAAYPSDSRFDVRIMGGLNTVMELLDGAPIPLNWSLYPEHKMPVRAFLEGIDFFVYFDNPIANEAFGRSLLEAMASGVVVVASPAHESTFGKAAVYCKPEEVRDLLDAFVSEPDVYRSQVEVAQSTIRDHFSPEAFRRILAMGHIPSVTDTVA